MPDWSLMNDLTTGDLVTEADMDALRGNLEYLLDPNHQRIRRDASDYVTTSTSFVDVDPTNLVITLETHGGPVLVSLSGVVTNGGSGAITYFDVAVDGTREGTPGATGTGLFAISSPTSGAYTSINAGHLVTGLAAGTHTFKFQWRVSGNTATLHAASDRPLHFSAIEL